MKIELDTHANRYRKCRACMKDIPIGEQSISMDGIYAAGNMMNLHFHTECWYSLVQGQPRNENNGE